VAIDALVTEEVDRRGKDASDAGVALRATTDGVPAILGSTRDLRLMIGNLIDNAIRYSQPGGAVDVRVRAEPSAVLISVHDEGVGIPQRDLPRIFERFYRVDQARSRDTGGTGLGLSIVKHVCENHDGTVSVKSELGVGSTFEVRLPTDAADTTL
jgi:signal transduction histidine kinase